MWWGKKKYVTYLGEVGCWFLVLQLHSFDSGLRATRVNLMHNGVDPQVQIDIELGGVVDDVLGVGSHGCLKVVWGCFRLRLVKTQIVLCLLKNFNSTQL